MGHHIDEQGRFQSDKYPDLPLDKVVISLKDSRCWRALMDIAMAYEEDDEEFAYDLLTRIEYLRTEKERAQRAAYEERRCRSVA